MLTFPQPPPDALPPPVSPTLAPPHPASVNATAAATQVSRRTEQVPINLGATSEPPCSVHHASVSGPRRISNSTMVDRLTRPGRRRLRDPVEHDPEHHDGQPGRQPLAVELAL